MPQPNSSHRSATASQRKNGSSSQKKASGQNTGFTFVDQSADLRSIADKKIADSDQRHLIRSHVMQKVRKDERLQGKKRPTGRDGSRKNSIPQSVTSSTSDTSVSHVDQQYLTIAGSELNWSSPSESIESSSTSDSRTAIAIPHAPSQGTLDPFNTLPGGIELSKITNNLIAYCFHTFIPMTFPMDSQSSRESTSWKLKVLQSQSTNTATFFGMMAIVAAHQGINSGRHRDLRPTLSGKRPTNLLLDNDFAIMKSQALQATHARIARNGWDGPTVEAIFSLIGAEQILGNFDEMRFHLSALKKFFANGLDPASPASNWIPLTDIKGAVATMSRPLFRLPWDPEPFSQDTLDKLYGWRDSELPMIGSAFNFVHDISSPLRILLRQASVLCLFCQFNAVRSEDLTPSEFAMFRRQTLELEHGLLSYVYSDSQHEEAEIPSQVSDLEQITRLAILGIISSHMLNALPSAGVGRALTHYQNIAVQNYYAHLTSHPDKCTAQLLIWAMMVFAQCAFKQPEERHFINNVAFWCQSAEIFDWPTMEVVSSSFLYVPAFQRKLWQENWSKACHYQQAKSAVHMVSYSPPQSIPRATIALRSQSRSSLQ